MYFKKGNTENMHSYKSFIPSSSTFFAASHYACFYNLINTTSV